MIPASSIARHHDAVLVVIDIQERLAAAMANRQRVIERAALLMRAAAITGVPIVGTRQYPDGLGGFSESIDDVLDEVAVAGATVDVFDKMSFDCFADEAFTQRVCADGRKQLVICGMETHICVTQTALSGLREGFDVHVVADGCCAQRDDDHATALARLAAAGAVISTSESVAYELVGVAGTPQFKRLLGAVKGRPLTP